MTFTGRKGGLLKWEWGEGEAKPGEQVAPLDPLPKAEAAQAINFPPFLPSSSVSGERDAAPRD